MKNLFLLAIADTFVFGLACVYLRYARNDAAKLKSTLTTEVRRLHRRNALLGFIWTFIGVILVLAQVEIFDIRFNATWKELQYLHKIAAVTSFLCMVLIFSSNKLTWPLSCMSLDARALRQKLMPLAYYLYVWVAFPVGLTMIWGHILILYLKALEGGT